MSELKRLAWTGIWTGIALFGAMFLGIWAVMTVFGS